MDPRSKVIRSSRKPVGLKTFDFLYRKRFIYIVFESRGGQHLVLPQLQTPFSSKLHAVLMVPCSC